MIARNIKPPVVLLTLAVLLLSGCAGTPASRDEIVRERAEQRWEAIFAKDYARAYEFYSPGYRTKYTATDLEIAIRLQKVRWTSASYSGQECEEKTCKVRFTLNYRVAAPVPGVDVYDGFNSIEEQWILTNGKWWYVPVNP